MVSVVCTSIHQWLENVGNIVVAVMDGHCPDVHKEEEAQICDLVREKQTVERWESDGNDRSFG